MQLSIILWKLLLVSLLVLGQGHRTNLQHGVVSQFFLIEFFRNFLPFLVLYHPSWPGVSQSLPARFQNQMQRKHPSRYCDWWRNVRLPFWHQPPTAPCLWSLVWQQPSTVLFCKLFLFRPLTRGSLLLGRGRGTSKGVGSGWYSSNDLYIAAFWLEGLRLWGSLQAFYQFFLISW